MWKKILFLLFVFIISNSLLAQTFDFTGNGPLLKIPITVKSTSDATKTFNLAFGIDSRATDAVDALEKLGETSLPPAPPAGVMDVRFKTGTDATLIDIRGGTETLKTGPSPKLHKLVFQPGDYVAGVTNIVIEYNIPANVSVLIKYVLFERTLTGSGSLTLTDGQDMGGFDLDLSGPISLDWKVTYNLPDLIATKIGLTVPNLNPVAGNLQTVTAQLQDQYDRPFAVSNTSIDWSTTSTDPAFAATLSAASTNTDATGKATVNLTVATKAGITHTIKAVSGTINKTSDNIVVKAGVASKFNVTVAKTDPAAGTNLQVTGQLQDQYSNNVTEADRAVTWISTNGATLANPSSGSPMIPGYKTDSDGKSVVGFIVSQTSGTKHKFTASAATPDITGESPEVTVVPGELANILVSSDLTEVKAGSNVTISAQLQDVYNNNISTSGKIITWSKTGGVAGDTGGKFATATSTTNASGVATVAFTVAQASGVVHTVKGSDGSIPVIDGTSGNINVIANDPNKYMVTSSDANPTVGTNITIDAQLTDLYGNLITTPTAKTVTWSYLGGTKGTFSAATSNTDANGKASVTFTVDEKSGVTQNVKATDAASIIGISPNIVTKAGIQDAYNVTSSNYSPVNGDVVTISAQAVDSFGNEIPIIGKVITWSSTNDGAFASPTTTTDANGKATVVFTTKNVPNTEHIITATDNSTPSFTGNSPKIKTVAGPPAKYLVTLSTNNPAAGSQVTVTAQLADTGNNPHSTAGKEVTWSSTGGGSFAQPKTVTDADGKAVVLFTVATISGDKHKVKATDNTTPTALVGESEEMTIKAAAASKFAVTLDKTDPIANTKVAVTAQLKDQYNNNAPENGREVSFTSTNGGVFDAPAGMAELTPAKFLTDATGKVTTNFLVVKVAGTKHTVTATIPSTSPSITGSSSEITVKSDVPINYEVSVIDTLPKAGKPITVTAQLKDQFANNVPTSGKIVTWSKTGGTGVTGGSFASVTTNTDATGKATVVFNVAQVSATTHEVIATDNSTPTALTGKRGNIVVVPDDASKYIVTLSELNPIAGEPINVDAQLADKYDNSVKIAGKLIAWESTNGGSFGGDGVPPAIQLGGGANMTDINGIAHTTFTTNTKALTEHIITATDDSTPALKGSSAKVITKAGPAVGYDVTASRYGPVKGDTIKIIAQVIDKNKNAVSLSGKNIMWSSTNDGAFSSPTSTTDATGKAIVVFATKNVPNTEHLITATDDSTPPLTGVSPKIKTVTGPPVKYIVTLSNTNPVAGTQLTVTAQLVDIDNNPHSTAGKEITWNSAGVGSFAQAKTLTNANGTAIVQFSAGTIAGNKHKISAKDNTAPIPLEGTSEEITIKADAAFKFAVTFDKTNPVADTKVAVTAQLKDKYNNNAPESNREVTFTSSNGGVFDPPASGAPELDPAKYMTDATGKVTTNFKVVTIAGTIHTVTATVPSTTPSITGTSGNLTVIADVPILYVVSISDTLPKAGKPITVRAQLKDQFANNAPVQGKKVTWSKTGGTGATGGNFASETTNTDASGIATVLFNVAQLSGTIHEVSATDNSAPTPLSGTIGNIVVVPDDASKYIVTASDMNPVVGSQIDVTAQLSDKFNNFVKVTGKQITWTSTNGGSFGNLVLSPGAQLDGGANLTNNEGAVYATFTTNTKALTEHVITATDNSAPALKGNSEKVITKAGPVAGYEVTASKYDPVKGDSVVITAQSIDAFKNPSALAGKTITWTSTNGGSFSPATSVTDIGGKASVMFTTKNVINTEHKVKATDNSTPQLTGESPVIKTVSGEPAKYIVTVSNLNPPAGSQITVTAQLTDEGDNHLAVTGKEVTWSSTGGGTFAQEKTTTDLLGRAVVSFTVQKQVGNIHRIIATDNSAPNALKGESGIITVGAANAYKLAISVDKTIAPANSKVLVTAQLKDMFDNNVPDAGKEIQFNSDNGGIFEIISQNPEVTKFITDANGRVSANFMVDKVAGKKHNIMANVFPDLTVISNTIELTVKPNVPAKFIVTVSDTLPKAGKDINVTAQLQDEFDNNVPMADKQVAWTKSGGGEGTQGGKFSYDVSETDAEGLAKVVFTVSQKSSVIHEVIATDNTAPNVLTGKRGNIEVFSDDASKYIVTVDDNNPTAGDSIFVSAQLSDKYDNFVKTADKELTWAISSELPKSENSVSSITAITEIKSKTNADGIATAKLLTSTKSLVKHIVSVKDDSSPYMEGKSDEIITKAGEPAKFLVKSENYFVIMGGSTKITGQLVDKNNNPLSKEGEIVSFSVNNEGIMTPTADTTDINGSITSTLKVSLVGNTKHIVEISGESLSGKSEEIQVVNIVPSALISPKNNSINLPLENQFIWSKAKNASSYDLQITTDSTFNEIGISKTAITDTTVKIDNLVNDTKYFWRVRANVGDASSEWAKSWEFTTIIAAPSVPELLSPADNTKNTDIALTLTWNKAERAEKYKFEFADNENFNPLIKDKVIINKEYFQITGLENGKMYYWRVKASNIGGESEYSQIFKFETIRIVAQPQGFYVNTISPNEVLIGWQLYSSAPSSFVLERRLNVTGGNFEIIGNPSGTSIRFSDVGLLENTEYQYRLKAIDDGIVSEYSSIVTVLTPTRKINPPTVIVIIPDSTGGLSLNWNDNSNNELGFIIYRFIFGLPASGSIKTHSVASDIFGEFVPIDTVDANITQYVDHNTLDGAKYAYKVSAFADEGVSVSATVETPIQVVAAPSDITATVDINNKITLNWKDNSNIESGYIIQRKAEGSSSFVTIDSVEASVTTFIDENTDEITSYTYLIYAFNSESVSSLIPSSEIRTELFAPSELAGTENGYKVTLTWKDNSKKELKYKIERRSLAEPTYKELVTIEKDITTYIDNVPNSNETYTYRITAIAGDIASQVSNEFEIKVIMTDVEEIDHIPTDYVMEQNYPNPFNPCTSIRFGLPYESEVHISIFNLIGEKIAEIENGILTAGTHSIRWDARNLSSGIYIYSISAKSILDGKSFNAVKKMMLLK
ncbi:MAG: hypothetical protein M0P71_00055 [Melioribacteraceae bacterium]|nr:hypothetical protein [Melioribacteraceae bacterium]